jgi:nucleoside-diphosphate-sugar epimerase
MKGESQMEREKAREWNIIDVRDIAETQRLAAESDAAANGTRYNMVANDEAGELPANQFLDTLQELFPNHNICGGYRPAPTDAGLRARCTKAIQELGLKTHSARDTLRDTGNSLIELGIVPEEVK